MTRLQVLLRRHGAVAAVAIVGTLLGFFAGAALDSHANAWLHSYLIVSGPEYRRVDREQFESFKPSCLRSVTRVYDELHVIVDICEV